MSRNRRRQDRPLDPDAVLNGKVDVTARELIELIHRINPTGLDLPRDETTRRYALKSRLQSLLIHDHPDELFVDETLDEERTISIRHRSGTDACHAVVAELDEAARDWARTQIRKLLVDGNDGDAPPTQAHDDTPRKTGPLSTMGRAREALDAYDYELAETLLLQALDEKEPGAGKMLLELWVDTLALDEKAITLTEKIDAADAALLPWFALAAARLGEHEQAEAWLLNLEVPRAADAWVTLATRSLDEKRVDDAHRQLTRAKACDPGHPAVLPLTERMKAARQEQKLASERGVEEALKAGDRAKAVALAQELSTSFPESSVAHRVLYEHGQDEMFRKSAALATKAREALSVRAFGEAASLFEEAARLARPDDEKALREEAARCRAMDADARTASEVTRLTAALAAGVTTSILRQIVEADAKVKDALEGATDVTEAHLAIGLSAHGSVSDVTQALTAIMESRGLSPEGALVRIQLHEPLLRLHPLGAALVDGLMAKVSAQRRTRNEDALLAVSRLTGAESPAELERAIAAVDASLLDEDQRRTLDHARLLARRARLEHTITEEERAGNLVAAAARVEEMIAFGVDGRARLADLHQRIREKHRVIVMDSGEESDVPAWLNLTVPAGDPQHWISDDGERLVLVTALFTQVFIQVIDVGSGRLRRLIALDPDWLPVIPSSELRWIIRGDAVRIAEERRIIDVSLVDGRLLRTLDLAAFVGRHALITMTFGGGGTHLVLMLTEPSGGPAHCVFLNVDEGRVTRRIEGADTPETIVGTHPTEILLQRGERPRRHRSDGAAIGSAEDAFPGELTAACAHPSGRGFVAAVAKVTGDIDGDARPTVEMLVCDDELRVKERLPLGRSGELHCALAPSPAPPMIHGCLTDSPGHPHLFFSVALDDTAAHIKRSISCEHPVVLALSHDARHISVVTRRGHHIRLRAPDDMRAEPPDIPGPLRLLDFRSDMACDQLGDTLMATGISLAAAWRGEAEGARDEWVRSLERKHDAAMVVKLAYALRLQDGQEAASAVVDGLLARHPDDAGARLLRAVLDVDVDRWDRVEALLTTARAASLDPGRAQHLHHLLALCFLRQGRSDEAALILHAGRMFGETHCPLHALLGLVENRDPETHPTQRLINAIRTAAARLDDTGPQAAIEALDHPFVWHSNELQSTARLAAAWLRVTTETALQAIRKRHALAVALYADSDIHAADLVIPKYWLDPEARGAILDEAAAWLKGTRVGER